LDEKHPEISGGLLFVVVSNNNIKY